MSAVSSGSSQGNAEVREPEGSHQSGSAQQSANFGANEWLVEELYQRYLADPGSVDRAWWSFFADYQPALANGTGPQPVISVAAPPAQAAAPPQAAPPQAPQAAAPPQAAPVAPAAQGSPAPQAAPAPAPQAAPAAPAPARGPGPGAGPGPAPRRPPPHRRPGPAPK